MTISRKRAIDQLHDAIKVAFDAGMYPADIELMAQTIQRSRAERIDDESVQGRPSCPIHGRANLWPTTLPSLVRVIQRNRESIFMCTAENAGCSWRYGTSVGTYFDAGQDNPDYTTDYNTYLKARENLGLDPGGRPWALRQEHS